MGIATILQRRNVVPAQIHVILTIFVIQAKAAATVYVVTHQSRSVVTISAEIMMATVALQTRYAVMGTVVNLMSAVSMVRVLAQCVIIAMM
jgi:hypothetical protein